MPTNIAKNIPGSATDLLRIDQLTHHIVAMKKVAEQHIFTKCCKCNTFEVISDLVHDFMNFNALKIIKKIY